jgi:hypothetical protein
MSDSRVNNDLTTCVGQREGKAYFTLAARYALAGLELVKGDWEVRGHALYYVTGHGLFQPLESLQEARAYIAKVTARAGHVEELQAQ